MMKSLLFFVCILVVCSTNSVGCPGPLTPEKFYRPLSSAFIFTPADKSITIPLNSTFQLALPSNPSTGYSWTYYKDLTNDSPVELVACYFIRSINYDSPDPRPLIGSGGIEYWELTTKFSGETDIELEYSRPWSRKSNFATEPDLTFQLTIETY